MILKIMIMTISKYYYSGLRCWQFPDPNKVNYGSQSSCPITEEEIIGGNMHQMKILLLLDHSNGGWRRGIPPIEESQARGPEY